MVENRSQIPGGWSRTIQVHAWSREQDNQKENCELHNSRKCKVQHMIKTDTRTEQITAYHEQSCQYMPKGSLSVGTRVPFVLKRYV